MNAQDQKTFYANVEWFNDFFTDLHNLFKKVAKHLEQPFGLTDVGFYYEKSNFTPGIPPYYVMALGNKKDLAVQVFAVLDPEVLDRQGRLLFAEPSFVFVAHAEGSKGMYFDDYGLSVMGGRQIRVDEPAERGAFTGSLRVSGKDIPFSAFQILLGKFGEAKTLNSVLDALVVPRLRAYVDRLKLTKTPSP